MAAVLAQDAKGEFHGLAWIALFDDDSRQRVIAGLAVAPHGLDRGHYQLAQGRHELLDVGAEEHVFLWRLADNGGREDGVFAVIEALGLEYRVVVLQRVIAVVIAERPLGLAHVRRHHAFNGEFGFGDQGQRGALHAAQALALQQRGQNQLGQILGQRRDGR